MNTTIVTYFSKFDWYQSTLKSLSDTLGFDASPLIVFLIFALAAFIVVNAMALVGGLGTYAERKISADLQARIGPNRVGPYGILQFLADGVKLIMKEDIIPTRADKLLFAVAPTLCLIGVFGSLTVLPFSSGFILSDLDIGFFFLIGISSLVGLGIFLGGYASNSKWSMLGGMRAAAQIISYEIPVVLSGLLCVLLAGGLSFTTLTEAQSGLPQGWFIFHNPFSFVAFFIFFIGGLAETNRAPFDLPEAESELVSGYHTEYTGIRFSFFALAEYIEVFVISGVSVAIFLGGYNVPMHLGGESFLGQILQVATFVGKTLCLYYVVIWIRWTLPRLRVDHLMVLCWKYLTPMALFNLIGAGFWMYYFNGKSLFDLIFKSGSAAAGGGH